MEFGVFDHLDLSGSLIERFYRERLEIVEAYERAGFYSYHVAEHHLTPLGMAPSPSVFLAAVAQRTQRLRFGPMVYVGPLYHPLRLLEEICMLDQMSGGRLEIAFGRGALPAEVRFFDVDPAQTEKVHQEVLGFILEGLSESAVTVTAQGVPSLARELHLSFLAPGGRSPALAPAGIRRDRRGRARVRRHARGRGRIREEAARRIGRELFRRAIRFRQPQPGGDAALDRIVLRRGDDHAEA